MYKLYTETRDQNKPILICSYCSKHRNATGYWGQEYDPNSSNTEVNISHGICPECYKEHFPCEYSSLCKEGKIEIREKTTSDNNVLYGCFVIANT